jgi:hypothetical protein
VEFLKIMINIVQIKAQPITCGHKTVGVQWFASIRSRINFFLGGYERAPQTQPFHTAKPLCLIAGDSAL